MSKWDGIKAKQAERNPDLEQDIARERALLALERQLYDLRRERGYSQAKLAKAIGTTQENISRIERVRDPHLSTLDNFITGLGGRLEIKAVFDDQEVLFPAPDDATQAIDVVGDHTVGEAGEGRRTRRRRV
jgi:transcriptional regulator with XRE-family HTH domain